MAKPI